MKVIDEKGKLFGKLNIIDVIVLILVVAVAAVLVLKITGAGSGMKGGTPMTYTVEVKGVRPQVYQEIKELLDQGPSQLMASGDLLNGYVVSVASTPSTRTSLTVAMQGEEKGILQTAEVNLLDLVFTVEANITNTVTNEIGPQEIRIGKTHIVKTTQFELENGVILSCEVETPA